ncbi:MAG: TlpA family protein disulfide reductase [Acidobacteria bacterium]|nr:TlpA family protein disulfide reductase [Acidobacteriota bacterium]
MPAFELSDVTGKTWRMKELGGKSVLINVWATWCGPCRAELPYLQKLYEKVKNRQDVQILTFNFDDNPGVITPYMKENGFAFPVLPAYDFVTGVLDSIAIPQNWIVDPKGVWRWTQMGFGGDPTWEESMLRKLESVKKGY